MSLSMTCSQNAAMSLVNLELLTGDEQQQKLLSPASAQHRGLGLLVKMPQQAAAQAIALRCHIEAVLLDVAQGRLP